jgi:predicted transcriptional regulator
MPKAYRMLKTQKCFGYYNFLQTVMALSVEKRAGPHGGASPAMQAVFFAAIQ